MKRITTIISSIILLAASLHAQTSDPFFTLPIIPDSITTLQNRTDYMITHYWDFCDLRKAFSAKQRMADSFGTYLELMPYASADKALASVNKLLKSIEKQPDDMIFLVGEAEGKLYADTAEYFSEQLYTPFVQALVANKKVPEKAKTRYRRQLRMLTSSQTGMPVPQFDYTDREGNKGTFAADTAVVTVLMFTNPQHQGAQMAKLRLDADIFLTSLIATGRVKMVCITPEEFTQEWQQKVSNYPKRWLTIAAPQAAELFDLRIGPSYWLIDETGHILVKNADTDYVINVMHNL